MREYGFENEKNDFCLWQAVKTVHLVDLYKMGTWD